MCYWASHPLHLFDTAQPLAPFLQQLAKAGRRTAREWYGVGPPLAPGDGESDGTLKGSGGPGPEGLPWVAHGCAQTFTLIFSLSLSLPLIHMLPSDLHILSAFTSLQY
jgi:hypothetical protein